METKITIALITGILGLIASIISSWIVSKKSQEVENLKSELQNRYFKLSKLHEKRLEVIEELYSRLIDLDDLIRIEIMPMKGGTIDNDKEELKSDKLSQNIKMFSKLFLKKRIYLTSNSASKINELLILMQRLVNFNLNSVYYINSGSEELWKQGIENKIEVMKIINERTPKLLLQLESELKGILENKS